MMASLKESVRRDRDHGTAREQTDSVKPPEHCKLCGGEVIYKFSLPLPAGLEGKYVECSSCRLLQSHHLDPISPSELEKRASYPPGIDLDPGAAWRLSCISRRIHNLLKLNILPAASPDFRALDFCSGTGFLVSYLAHRYGWRAVGYDPYCAPAYAQGKVFRDWALVEQRGPYQLIIASEVFEHFTDPRDELHRLRDVLAAGCAFLYVTTGRYFPEKTTAKWTYLAPQSGHHVSFYARQTMEKIATLIGASGLYQAGSEYEWLFAFGSGHLGWQRAKLRAASALLQFGMHLGVIAASK